ncbi:MAG: DUF4199 domain-containing protein [Bacteroidales bacterium]|nr:DUF4199 domain-containing protein [Bacteroidales bacterium]
MSKKFKIILSLGAIICLQMILMSVIAYAFEMSDAKWFGYLSFLIFIITIVFVQKYYRDNFYDGYANYSKIFGGTFLMIIVASVIVFLYTFLFYKFVAPEQIVKMLEMAEINLYEQDKLTQAQIDTAINSMKTYVFTPIALSLSSVLTTVFQGVIVALVSSIFIKKNPDAFADAMKGIDNE